MNQKGFAHLQLALVAVLVVAAVTVTGVKVLHKYTKVVQPTKSPPASVQKSRPTTQQSSTRPPTPVNQQTTGQAITTSNPKNTNSTINSSTSIGKSGSSPVPQPSNPPSTPTASGPTNPTVSNLVPANGATVTGNEITFNCSYTTPAGFNKLVVSTVDHNGQDANTGFEQDIASAGCQSQLDITYVDNGQYTSTFTVYDVNGKTASATTTYTISH